MEKSSAEGLLFSLMMSDQALTLRHGQTPLAISFRTKGRIPLESWTHLVLQVTNIKQSGRLKNGIHVNMTGVFC